MTEGFEIQNEIRVEGCGCVGACHIWLVWGLPDFSQFGCAEIQVFFLSYSICGFTHKMRGHVVGLKAVAPDWLRGSGLWFMVAVIKEAHLIADNELNATLPAPCKRGIQGG
jgi:hypothetical protein